ncbi:hypothetical protein E2C01_054360 [Portunus trituberculatus]|uniref:Uncharacterized protein n=1 Tax=Portunus trituberculatus TaxID=210409 RepID=A0A5B7GRT7_PORTR|nr:hypothetical protein [Portunus trituberculatus]
MPRCRRLSLLLPPLLLPLWMFVLRGLPNFPFRSLTCVITAIFCLFRVPVFPFIRFFCRLTTFASPHGRQCRVTEQVHEADVIRIRT